jgi:hypothetical protein
MFAISESELTNGDWVEPGDRVHCTQCGGSHELKAGTDQNGQPAAVLLFYSCGTDSFLGAVKQMTLPGVHLVIEK